VDENLKDFQDIDIPRIEQWPGRAGPSFAVEKTEFIYFTRKKAEQQSIIICMNNQAVKLLGMVFDLRLRWRSHVRRAVKRATAASLAIGRLRYLRPAQMR